MGWKTVIIGCECKVSLSMNRMKISIDNEYQHIPLTDLNAVIFTHQRVVMTIPILSELVKNNVNIIICDEKNDPIGIFQPFNTHSLVFKQLQKQIDWKVTRKKKLWKKIIELKIQSEIDILELLSLKKDAIEKLKIYRNSVYTDDQSNREAVAARLYFTELFGPSFNRNESNAINAALNYGYKIIASQISKCIASRGLLTQLGIHHIGESNPFNLTYDFIEPFRAIVDAWVYQNIEDSFGPDKKVEIIELLNQKVFSNNMWFRLSDAIEDIIDSYIAFLNEESDSLIAIDLSEGIRNEL